MSAQPDRRRRPKRQRPIRARDRSIASLADEKSSPCPHDDNSHGAKRVRYSGPDLPEDVLGHIHSLMPLRDAARVACVSRIFLSSWRFRPNITFSTETLGLDKNVDGEAKKNELAQDFTRKIDHILKNHSGVGLKALSIAFYYGYNADPSCYLNRWLEIAATQTLEELTLWLPFNDKKHKFPCSFLSNGSGSSIRHLTLSLCSFRPTVGLDHLRNLTRVHLSEVRITGDELGCLFSRSLALEQLQLRYCNQIICLKIPCLLQRLSYVKMAGCSRLKLIEIKAPNVSSFDFYHEYKQMAELSFQEPLQMKDLRVSRPGAIDYALGKLPSIMPNLETLSLGSHWLVMNTPTAPRKFLHLKHLSLYVEASPAYDYLSLVSCLEAAPSLETFNLALPQQHKEINSIIGEDPSNLRKMSEHNHTKLKTVKITRFFSAKSLVELTCHILENAPSLNHLTLDTTIGFPRSCATIGRCPTFGMDIMEGRRAVSAVQEYIQCKVPPTVKLHVVEPCSVCHPLEP